MSLVYARVDWRVSQHSSPASRAARDRRDRHARGFLDSDAVEVTCEQQRLAEVTFMVEAIVEDQDAKAALFGELAAVLAPGTVLASTTSSLSAEALAAVSGRADRFAALHVFNPVTKDGADRTRVPRRRERRDARPHPLALLDLVGLDVAQAIGRTIGVAVPARIDALVAEGGLGRKSGRGFHSYES